MPNADRDNPGKGIQVPSSGLVEYILHMPFDDHQRLLVVGEDRWVVVCPPLGQHLRTGRAVVRIGMVGAGRYLRQGRGCGHRGSPSGMVDLGARVAPSGLLSYPAVPSGRALRVRYHEDLIRRGHSFFEHSNVNLSYGPLSYIFVCPLFHRWHHSSDEAAIDKNFANIFSFFDLGTSIWYAVRPLCRNAVGAAVRG